MRSGRLGCEALRSRDDGGCLRPAASETSGWVTLATLGAVGRSPDCPDCGVVATAHDRRTVQMRDLATGGRPCRLVWSKRIWRCPDT